MSKIVLNPGVTETLLEEEFITDLCIRLANTYEENGFRPFVTRMGELKAKHIPESVQINININKSNDFGSIQVDCNPELHNYSNSFLDKIKANKLNYMIKENSFASNLEFKFNYVPLDLTNNAEYMCDMFVKAFSETSEELKKIIDQKYTKKKELKVEESEEKEQESVDQS